MSKILVLLFVASTLCCYCYAAVSSSYFAKINAGQATGSFELKISELGTIIPGSMVQFTLNLSHNLLR